MLRFVIYVLGLSSAWAQNFDPDLDVADYKDMYGNHDPGIAEENIGGEYMGGDEYYYGGGYGMEDYGKEFGAGDNKGDYIYEYGEGDDFFNEDFLKALNETERQITPRRIIVPTVYGIIAIVGLVLNPIAVFIAQKTKNLKYSQRIFLQNLCVASFLVCINVPIPAIYRATNWWYFGTIVCKIHNCLSNYTLLSQAYFAVALCYDFTLLKCRPNIPEKTRTILEILILELGWMTSLGFSFPMLLYSEERYGQCGLFFDKEPEEKLSDMTDYEFDTMSHDFLHNFTMEKSNVACNIPPEKTKFKLWIICSFVFSYVLPLVALILAFVVYHCCACDKKSRQVERQALNGDNNSEVREETDIKAEESILLEKKLESNENNNNNTDSINTVVSENITFMITGNWVSFIGISYFVCWLPLHVYHLGRIPGYYLSLTSCHNVRDYAFIQGYLTAILFPFMTICYCRPNVLKIWRKKANINFTRRSRPGTSRNDVVLRHTTPIQTV